MHNMVDMGGFVFALRCVPGSRRYLRMLIPYVFPQVSVHIRDAESQEGSPVFAICLIVLRVAEEVFNG